MSFRNDKLSPSFSSCYRWWFCQLKRAISYKYRLKKKKKELFQTNSFLFSLSSSLFLILSFRFVSFRAWSTFIFQSLHVTHTHTHTHTRLLCHFCLPCRSKTFSPFHTYKLLIMMLISKSMEHQEHFEIISTIFMRPFR